MAVGNHTESLSIGGRIMQRNVDLTADNDAGYGGASAPIELAVPSAVTSWVKTDADQAAGDVGRDEADEGDRPRHRNGDGRQRRAEGDEQQAIALQPRA